MLLDSQEYQDFIAGRIHEGTLIDPATAIVARFGCLSLDHYGVAENVYEQTEVGLFVRRPEGDWVHFDELPEATREAIFGKPGEKDNAVLDRLRDIKERVAVTKRSPE